MGAPGESTAPPPAARPALAFDPAGLVRRYALPLLFFASATPVTVYAIYRSVHWIDTPFPAFLLMENRVIPTVSGVAWPPDKAEVFHAQVVAVDGVAVSSSAEIYGKAAGLPVGTGVAYGLRKGGETFERRIATRRFSLLDYLQVYVILLLIGALNLVLGCIVAVLQPGNRQANTYVAMSVIGCLFATTAVFLHQPGFPLLTFVYLAAESLFPAAFIHFALTFPVDRFEPGRGGRRMWRWVAVAYGVATVLAAVKMAGFYSEPPNLLGLWASYLYLAASFAVFFSLMALAWRQETDPLTRLRIRPLVPTVSIGCALAVFVFLNNTVAGGDLPMQLGLLVVPIFYGGIAYAIVAHDLFGIDRFVRWTFVYALLSLLVYLAYTLMVTFAPALAEVTGGNRQIALGLGFVSLALLLDPLRRLVQSLVDRVYYRTPWSYRGTISRVSREMTTWRSVDRIMEELTRVLTRDMQIETTAVCLLNGMPPWYRRADAPLRRLEGAPAPAALRLVGAGTEPLLAASLLERTADETVRGELAAFLRSVQAAVLLPLVFAERLTGIVTLGPTRSRRPLHSEDLELLRTLADQTAIAIENALSYEALEQHNRTLNETVRQRTAQLMQSEQLAALGQLVAGVAHELNNPVGAVYSSVENLRAQLESLQPSDDTRELLDICSEGSERIRVIVRDLLSFARSDRGERLPTDVAEGLESTLRLLADRLVGSGVEIRRDFRPAPRIEANISQLNQVWMNLLSNAIDAVHGRPSPCVQLRVCRRQEESGDWVEVEVRDNGAGMSDEVKAKIFEPFFTTKQIGAGTGLGMSIAYGVVRDHGGSIQVESRPGEGSTLRVLLPVRPGRGSTAGGEAAAKAASPRLG